MIRGEWPADKVERWPLDRLIPYARNARTHDDAQVAQIAASIKEWGWTTPVLVDENGTIIAGHGRVLAARQLGLQEAPVMVARGWSEAQCRAYVLADNKLAENAGWDNQILMLEVADLNTLGFDLSLVGFSDRELTSFSVAQHQGLTDPDDIPDAPVDPVSRIGDV
jgi:ParB-like chromosome segregation protein Spo0J